MAPATRITRMKLRWRHLGGVLLGLAVAGVGLRLMRHGAHSQEIETESGPGGTQAAGLSVDVVRPRRGGIPRTIQQPASIHSFESVELYAMVSGYLKKQDVDIGSRIKKGEVLAEINVPRDAKAVEEAASLMEQARAQVVQAQARIKVTRRSRTPRLLQSRRLNAISPGSCPAGNWLKSSISESSGLVAERAATRLLADEQQLDLETTTAAERSGHLEIDVAKAKLWPPRPPSSRPRPTLQRHAQAWVSPRSHLEKAKVNLDYSRIVAPFDGVVTHRSFHPGALIRSATEGGQPQPLLTVKRIDVMRLVVLVPDRDVVLTRQGDPAVVTVDALGGRSFQGTLATNRPGRGCGDV